MIYLWIISAIIVVVRPGAEYIFMSTSTSTLVMDEYEENSAGTS